MPIFEFVCTSNKCKQQDVVVEHLCKIGDNFDCEVCQMPLVKMTSTPVGRVKGGTPKLTTTKVDKNV